MNQELSYKQQLAPYFQGADSVLLDRLLQHAAYLYESLHRYSGEPYFMRALRLTCEKILKLHPDRSTIMASVLISACYSPRCDLAEIERMFGADVRGLVESLGKINSIKSRYSASDSRDIVNMFLTLAKDIRVIIIRLADRIENMETLQYKSEAKQKANAREILDVYVPIAAKLGLYEFKLILQDLAFKYIFPEEYQALEKDMQEYMGQTQKNIDEIRLELETLLKENGFDVTVTGRVKSLFSVYNKLKKKTATLADIYDVFALRVVLKSDENAHPDKPENIETLYKILSILHAKYVNLPDRFKNYVSNPKSNGYQSLHTALIGLNSVRHDKPTEVQIRTAAMDKFAEHGYAAHWLYKQAHQLPDDGKMLRLWSDLRKGVNIIDGKLALLKMNLFTDRVFVLTPGNLVKELPLGATPVDFAFNIHSEIGHHCSMARVNGKAVPLDYKLKNGDIVEVLTSSKVNTKLSWLEFVCTKQARNRIKNYFRALDKNALLDQGKQEFNTLLEKMGLEPLDEHLLFLKKYKNRNIAVKEREEILQELAAGTITSSVVFRNCTGKSPEVYMLDKTNAQANNRKGVLLPRSDRSGDLHSPVLLIGGERNMPYRIPACCKPKLTDKIVGYVTKTQGISLHKVSCSFVVNAPVERLLTAELESPVRQRRVKHGYYVSLMLDMEQQIPLKQLVDYFTEQNITIFSFDQVGGGQPGEYQRKLILDIGDEGELQELIEYLGKMTGVRKVSRL